MNHKFIRLILTLLFISFSFTGFCETSNDTSPEEYNKDEIPQALHDLRRFEIITLGALPFVTLDATLTYSTIRYAQHNFDSAYIPNIFASSQEGGFTTEEQFGILLSSLGISVGIGITDYIVRLISRNVKKKKILKTRNKDLTITSISDDPEATKIELNVSSSDSDNIVLQDDVPFEVEN